MVTFFSETQCYFVTDSELVVYELWRKTDIKEFSTTTSHHHDVITPSPASKTAFSPTNSSTNPSSSPTTIPAAAAATAPFFYCLNTSRGFLHLRVWASDMTKMADSFPVYRQSPGSRTFHTEPAVEHNCIFLIGDVVNTTGSSVAVTVCNECEMVRNVVITT